MNSCTIRTICCLLLATLLTHGAVCSSTEHALYSLHVTTNDGLSIQAGLPTVLCVDIADASEHSLLHPLRLRPLHCRLLHIVLLPATYSSVLHVHLEDYPAFYDAYLASDHCAAINVTLPSAGCWVVGVDLWPADAPSMVTATAVLDVVGGAAVRDYPVDARPRQVVTPLPLQHGQRYTAAVQRGAVARVNDRTALIDVQLDGDKRPIGAAECCPLTLSVSTAQGNERVDDLLPLLTLPAHLFLFHFNASTGDYRFHHLHAHASHLASRGLCLAAGEDGMAGMTGMSDMQHMDGMDTMESHTVDERFGPTVQAGGVRFDRPGRWMVVGQLRRAGADNATSDGELLTVMIDVIVE